MLEGIPDRCFGVPLDLLPCRPPGRDDDLRRGEQYRSWSTTAALMLAADKARPVWICPICRQAVRRSVNVAGRRWRTLLLNLYAKLQRRQDNGNPIPIGLIGAGKFGSMFLSQVRHIPGIHLYAIADLSAERAREAMARAG